MIYINILTENVKWWIHILLFTSRWLANRLPLNFRLCSLSIYFHIESIRNTMTSYIHICMLIRVHFPLYPNHVISMLTMFILPFSRSANVQDVLYDARVYSYYLSQFWNVSTCDANTLLLYSKDDDIVGFILGSYIINAVFNQYFNHWP